MKTLDQLSAAATDIAFEIGRQAHEKTGVTPALREVMTLHKANKDGLADDAIERVVPEEYASIKLQLGHIIPCYDDPTGCILDDEENDKRCGEGCFILSVYRAGAIAAMKDTQPALAAKGTSDE